MASVAQGLPGDGWGHPRKMLAHGVGWGYRLGKPSPCKCLGIRPSRFQPSGVEDAFAV